MAKRMTGAGWLSCKDPDEMLGYLSSRSSDRKRRLFACACCRRIWHLLPDERCRRAVEVAEQLADSRARTEDLLAAGTSIHETFRWGEGCPKFAGNATLGILSARLDGFTASFIRQNAARAVNRSRPRGSSQRIAGGERVFHVGLIRCIFGDPFRTVTLDPSGLARDDGTVADLARAIYEGRRFSPLPILADALEEGGCTDESILDHCRGPGPHARGCWVVDLILGKS
jgi:hypothetical protein